MKHKSKYREIAIEKPDREAIVSCLNFILTEFDRISAKLDKATEKIKQLNKRNKNEK